jgi:hypothetical protein
MKYFLLDFTLILCGLPILGQQQVQYSSGTWYTGLVYVYRYDMIIIIVVALFTFAMVVATILESQSP